jgi:hypothetical protein
MGTIRKAKSAEIDPSSSASVQIATDANASAAAWWAQWAKNHEAQIEAIIEMLRTKAFGLTDCGCFKRLSNNSTAIDACEFKRTHPHFGWIHRKE